MTRRRAILILIAVAAAAIIGFRYFVADSPCSDFFPCHDSTKIVAMEEHELLRSAKAMFEKNERSPYKSRFDKLPKPLGVHIAGGPGATLSVAGPISSNSLQYAAEWYRVYHRYHGGTRTVSLHVVWRSGALTQTFPVNEI